MKKMMAVYTAAVLLFITSWAVADDITDSFNRGKNYYLAQNYYTSIRNGMQAVDGVCRILVEKLVETVPELDQFIVFKTNYFYTFGGEQTVNDASIRVEKQMSNASEIVTIGFDNSLSMVQSYQSLLIGFDYLRNSGNYAKTNYSTRYSRYDCIIENNDTAYFPFVYQETNGMVQSGMVMRVNFQFRRNLTVQQKRAKMDQYLYQILVKLKTGTLKYILQ